MLDTSLDSADLLNVLGCLWTDESAYSKARPRTFTEREDGGKVDIFVDAEDFRVRRVGVCTRVRVLEDHFETVVTRKALTVVEIRDNVINIP